MKVENFRNFVAGCMAPNNPPHTRHLLTSKSFRTLPAPAPQATSGPAPGPHGRCAAAAALAAFHAHSGACVPGSSCAGCAADADAVWAYGGCAAQGDVWCLLSLAHLAAEAASHAPPRRAAPLRASSLRLLHTAAAAVHAATDAWEVWFTGGASAALGSFAVLASSGGDAGFATGQLSAVAALVTDAASEEGGAELWVLQVGHKGWRRGCMAGGRGSTRHAACRLGLHCVWLCSCRRQLPALSV